AGPGPGRRGGRARSGDAGGPGARPGQGVRGPVCAGGGRRPPHLPVLRAAARPRRARLPAGQRLPQVTDRPDPPDLEHGLLTVEEVLGDASNLTVRVAVDGAGHAVYKPVSGERPLHDFPLGSLARREVAAYRVSALGGWDLVPRTVLRDGPLGPGALQQWVDRAPGGEDLPAGGLVAVVPPEELEPGWLPVVGARTEDGRPLLVVHADDPVLRSVTVLDAVLNNADRKASHLLRDASGRLWGIDHGLCLH